MESAIESIYFYSMWWTTMQKSVISKTIIFISSFRYYWSMTIWYLLFNGFYFIFPPLLFNQPFNIGENQFPEWYTIARYPCALWCACECHFVRWGRSRGQWHFETPAPLQVGLALTIVRFWFVVPCIFIASVFLSRFELVFFNEAFELL